MPHLLIYLSDVQVAARYGVHRTTPWRWAQADGSFPKPSHCRLDAPAGSSLSSRPGSR